MSIRFLALTALGVVVSAAVAGCGSSSTSGADQPPNTTDQDASIQEDGTTPGDGATGDGAIAEGGGGTGGDAGVDSGDAGPVVTGDFVVLAWNDLGMHCLNPRYDEAVILPPYNTLWAQVLRKGNPPSVETAGLTVEYRIIDNTYSYGKVDSFGADFGQFWDHSQALFGVDLPKDKGLNLEDPSLHNGLSGKMVAAADHFHVNGIPLTPVTDNGTWDPYQVAEITVKNSVGTVLAQTRATVPTSDEIDCESCHKQGGSATSEIGGGQGSAFHNLLQSHDRLHGTSLVNQKPVLCASCHGSPALGQTDQGATGIYLSAAIHSSHAPRGATCYSCHPGSQTQCSRSLAHTAVGGNCTSCHGDMAQVGQTAASGSRTPWANEPKCVTCHPGVAQVDTGDTLYRNAAGHGNVYCAGCHGSPHAMLPSREAADNYQALQYQQSPKTIGSCGACHDSSKGEGAAEFGDQHAGAGATPTACNVCHTQVSADTAKWPHSFQWKAH